MCPRSPRGIESYRLTLFRGCASILEAMFFYLPCQLIGSKLDVEGAGDRSNAGRVSACFLCLSPSMFKIGDCNGLEDSEKPEKHSVAHSAAAIPAMEGNSFVISLVPCTR
jgi:hypothetical protein